ncbi:hypothetical protein F441_05206 [Phytophthora nicotianae CJ01A1]|uniref:Uncharacterized protein n=1 Tax=Phytophthora nicotianae CJ01A1 TaxID=1317063 RepID=W2XFG5_PHYNI|nr:hypothetical protein F441_05206 [Phytophthora nicotianae CJ01A1]
MTMPLSDLTARLSAAILLMLHGAGISMMESSRKGHWWCDSGCSEHGWRAAKGIVGAAQGAGLKCDGAGTLLVWFGGLKQ